MLINLLSSRNFRTYVVGIIMRYGVYHQTQYNKPSFSESVREKIWWTEHKRPENINIKQISDVPYNMYLFYVVRRLVLKVLTWQCIALTKTHDIHMYTANDLRLWNIIEPLWSYCLLARRIRYGFSTLLLFAWAMKRYIRNTAHFTLHIIIIHFISTNVYVQERMRRDYPRDCGVVAHILHRRTLNQCMCKYLQLNETFNLHMNIMLCVRVHCICINNVFEFCA